jgi:hypothetical protein
MWLSFTVFYELIANFFREWDVNETITMDMPYLSFSNPVGRSAKTMWRLRDTFPGPDRTADCLLSSVHRHKRHSTHGIDILSIHSISTYYVCWLFVSEPVRPLDYKEA